MAWSSLSSARFTAAVADRVEGPRTSPTLGKFNHPVIFMAGGASTAATGFGEAAAICDALIAAGFTVFMPSVPNLAGNATADTRIADTITYANAQGFTDTPVIVGQSNGANCGFLYAQDHAVAVLVGVLPPLSAEALYTHDTGSTRAILEAAWSVTYPAALPAGSDINKAAVAGSYASIAVQLWTASDDTISSDTLVVPGTAITQFAAAVPHAELRSVGALGHTTAAVQAVDAAAVVTFVLAHL